MTARIEGSMGVFDAPIENAPIPLELLELPALRSSNWQMSFGERAALEGLLSRLGTRRITTV